MPRSKTQDRAQFSVKLPEELEDEIESYADETHRSKSNALIHLAHVGMMTDVDHIEDDDRGEGSAKIPISVSTMFTDVVKAMKQIADDEFGGVFSRACRWSIRNGLAVEQHGQ